jgi:Peptidase S46
MTSTRCCVAGLTLCLLVTVSLMPTSVLGDEGMFLPDTLTQLPLTRLKQRGLKIPITDIYDPNGPSIKDAVVIVDGGTGEFVSPEGLLLTNHHVAFDALVSASDPSKDYAENGYFAKSRAEELPARGYNVTITQDLKAVTDEILNGIPDTLSPEERAQAIQTKVRAMENSGANRGEGISVRVLAMNDGLVYYKFTYLSLPDVRIVYAPPKNIGFFGGDPDNFEWPRHDGDFTFMRVYTGPDGKPAEYSTANVPYKPKKFLSLSMGGVKEGEFMMVMGYPGSTRRYRESYSVAYNQDIAMPFLIDLFTYQINTLRKAGENDAALRIKLESTIFGLSNELKNYEGSVLAMRRAGIVEQKRAQEAEFTRWVNADPAHRAKYGDVLPSLAKAYQELTATAQRDLLLQQMFQASDLIGIASFAQRAAADKEKPEAERNPALGQAGLMRIRAQIPNALVERNPTAERELLTYLLRKAAELPAEQKIDFIEKRFGNLQGEARRRAEEDFAREVVDSKRYSTAEGLSAIFEMTAAQLRETHDPLIEFAIDLSPAIQKIQTGQQAFNAVVQKWRPLLVRGMSEMRGTKPYPDANRTLRFTYGEVKGYIPRDAAIYEPFTHLSGVIEKDTGSEPFDVPAKLKELYRTRDFGPYADGQDVPVNFLSTTDIIGGNSGSPIMNGRGEQVGIVFDGNYEGLGNDFFYNDAKGRTIAVDIRYVLFIADKFGGAGYLLKELDIKNAPAALRRAA